MRELQERELKLREKYAEIQTPEALKFIGGGITVSGPSGTGKTTMAVELPSRYGFPEGRIFKVGASLRDELGDSLGKRPVSKDADVDEIQAVMIRRASKKNPFVLEGRLSGIIKARVYKELRSKGIEIPPVVAVLLICEEHERMDRLMKRHNKENPDNKKNIATITKEELQREKDDLKRWREAHPDWNLRNPFNPGMQIDGRKVYPITIDTTGKSVMKVVEELDGRLMKFGLIEKVIFKAPSSNGNH